MFEYSFFEVDRNRVQLDNHIRRSARSACLSYLSINAISVSPYTIFPCVYALGSGFRSDLTGCLVPAHNPVCRLLVLR